MAAAAIPLKKISVDLTIKSNIGYSEADNNKNLNIENDFNNNERQNLNAKFIYSKCKKDV